MYVPVCVSCKDSQKRILRGAAAAAGGGVARTNRWTRDIRDTAKERCVLGTINTERLLSWVCLGILGAGG